MLTAKIADERYKLALTFPIRHLHISRRTQITFVVNIFILYNFFNVDIDVRITAHAEFYYYLFPLNRTLARQQPSAPQLLGTTTYYTPLLALSSHLLHSILRTFLFEQSFPPIVLFASTRVGSLAPRPS